VIVIPKSALYHFSTIAQLPLSLQMPFRLEKRHWFKPSGGKYAPVICECHRLKSYDQVSSASTIEQFEINILTLAFGR
jgi:hypothetical protein